VYVVPSPPRLALGASMGSADRHITITNEIASIFLMCVFIL
jgi:hypothetical protein